MSDISRSRSWKVWLGVALIFVSGVVVGGVGTGLYIQKRAREGIQGWHAGELRPHMRRALRDLELSGEQESRLKEIMRGTRRTLRDLRRQNGPASEQVMNEALDTFRQELRPDQLGAFDRLRERAQKRRERFGKRFGRDDLQPRDRSHAPRFGREGLLPGTGSTGSSDAESRVGDRALPDNVAADAQSEK